MDEQEREIRERWTNPNLLGTLALVGPDELDHLLSLLDQERERVALLERGLTLMARAVELAEEERA